MELETCDQLAKLEALIGHRFRDRLLLEEALTHRSFRNEAGDDTVKDNERLEFFGDSVLGFLVSAILLERFPGCREGELTRKRATFVTEESLAFLARQIDLGSCLRLGRGEEKSAGREKRSLLADAYEALLAAVYLDGGLDAARRLVESHFIPLLDHSSTGPGGRDFKTEFQELAQARLGATPRYVIKESSGPGHDLTFVVETLVGEECMGEGTGRSRKEAEQGAARTGIDRLTSGDSVDTP
jgi:ribonuclease-3